MRKLPVWGIFGIVFGSVRAAGTYKKDDPVELFVNKVGPYFNPHETYHYYSLPEVTKPQQFFLRNWRIENEGPPHVTLIRGIFKLLISAYNKKCPGQRFYESLFSFSTGSKNVTDKNVAQDIFLSNAEIISLMISRMSVP